MLLYNTYRETGVTNTTCQKMIFSTFEVKIKLYFIFKSRFLDFKIECNSSRLLCKKIEFQ